MVNKQVSATILILIWSLLVVPLVFTKSPPPRVVLKRSLTGLNSEFSFSTIGCHTKVKVLSLPYYLPIARARIVGCISFPRVLLCEMQITSSWIRTLVALSIFYDDNYYDTSYSLYVDLCSALSWKEKENLYPTRFWSWGRYSCSMFSTPLYISFELTSVIGPRLKNMPNYLPIDGKWRDLFNIHQVWFDRELFYGGEPRTNRSH